MSEYYNEEERVISEAIHKLEAMGYTGSNSETLDRLNKFQTALLPDNVLRDRYYCRKEEGKSTTKLECEMERRGLKK